MLDSKILQKKRWNKNWFSRSFVLLFPVAFGSTRRGWWTLKAPFFNGICILRYNLYHRFLVMIWRTSILWAVNGEKKRSPSGLSWIEMLNQIELCMPILKQYSASFWMLFLTSYKISIFSSLILFLIGFWSTMPFLSIGT